MMASTRLRRLGAALVGSGLLLVYAAAGCDGRHLVESSPTRPDIVFVLTDDLSANLVRFMPHVLAMEAHGMTFTDYTVTDSLCCPSRSSIFTGEYPHDTGVFTNDPPDGGYTAFNQHGNASATFAVALQGAGYRTALMGKYLNGYQPGTGPGGSSTTPPGWDEWDAVGNGYLEYHYRMAQNGSTRFYGRRPADYLTTVLQNRATTFIASAAASGRPFFLEVATFAPHRPYVAAPTDAEEFPGLTPPRTPAFDRLPTNPPPWLVGHPPLTAAQIRQVDDGYRHRAQDVLSVDRLLAAVQTALARAGVSGRTDVIFSSDNGYHMGEYRLGPGKMTAFDTDVNVPLIATGPDIPVGTTAAEVQNIDLAPTFTALAGLAPNARMDGTSILGLIHHLRGPGPWAAALVEHHGPDRDHADPDYQGPAGTNPPSYDAIRTATYTYVEYAGGGAEYYDRTTDPWELHNLVDRLSAARRARLHRELHDLMTCHGNSECSLARHAS